MIFKYFKRRRERLVNEIANAVSSRIGCQSWEKFFPPVAFRDAIYMVTENGTIYRLCQDYTGMEVITKIRH